MGRRRADGRRALADWEGWFLRKLATDRRSGRAAVGFGHGLPAVVPAGERLLLLGLAHRLSDQRRAGRSWHVYPPQNYGDPRLRSRPASAKTRARAVPGAVPRARQEPAAWPGRPLYRRRDLHRLWRLHYRLSHRRTAFAAADSAGGRDDLVCNNDLHAGRLWPV